MKCSRLLVLLLFLFSTSVAVDIFDNSKLIQTLKNAREDRVVSDKCEAALELYAENLQSTTDQWAFRMLDASSKIPVGILSYNFGELGQFTQCLGTKSEDGSIKPKYCLGTVSINFNSTTSQENAEHFQRSLQIREAVRTIINFQTRDDSNTSSPLTSMGISWAICLPSDCSNEDVAEILSDFINPSSLNCQTNEDLSPPLTAGAIGTIVVLALFACILIVSTALDLYYQSISRVAPPGTPSINIWENIDNTLLFFFGIKPPSEKIKSYKSLPVIWKYTFASKGSVKEPPHVSLIAFSVYTNGEKLFRMNKDSNELTCLNGIRFWSMMWVIIGHVFSITTMFSLTNYKDVIEWIETLGSMTIVSGTLSVDSFFVMAGALIVYSYFKSKHYGRKFNIAQFYIHRYLRLTPAVAVGILVTAHLLKYIGTGPQWNYVEYSLARSCRKYWWTTLLYVQNYVNDDMVTCLPQTWYLSVDMQLYVISPLFLIPLWKYPKIGVGLIITSIVAFIITPFCIAYTEELVALMTNFTAPTNLLNMMQRYYVKTHARAAPWFIGVLLGYILAKMKFFKEFQFTLNKVVIYILWAVFLAVGLACIYGGHSTLMGPDYDRLGNSFHIGLVRPVWALCMAWVIFACVNGYGGPINWFLSLPIYQVLNRFTYSIYLIHYPLLIVLVYMSKTGIYFDELSLAYSFWGITMFSFGLSVIWVLAFESPIVVLEKLIFSQPKKKNVQQENGKENKLSP